MINGMQRALQSELDSFFDQTLPSASLWPVTKSAFCQARKSLHPQAIRGLLQHSANLLSDGFSAPLWQGLRVLALDSSIIRVPNTPECAHYFGVMNTSCGKQRPLARASALWDVARHCFVDAILGQYSEDDRTLALQHLPQLSPKDLVVMDRGYPSRELMAAFVKQHIPFCARITTHSWKVVKQFVQSTPMDQTLDMSNDHNPLILRLVKHRLPNGTVLILVTNLLAKEIKPIDFAKLYRHRWRIEEAFKLIKARLHIENWSGILPIPTEQDFYTTLIRANCAACLRLTAKPLPVTLDAANEPLPHGWRQKLNQTYSVSCLRDYLPRLILFAPCLNQLKILILRLLKPAGYVMTKPDRVAKRTIGVRIQGFHPAYKPA